LIAGLQEIEVGTGIEPITSDTKPNFNDNGSASSAAMTSSSSSTSVTYNNNNNNTDKKFGVPSIHLRMPKAVPIPKPAEAFDDSDSELDDSMNDAYGIGIGIDGHLLG
jgi:hypothetical protein